MMHGAEGKAGMIEQQTACTSQPRLYRRMEFLKAPGMAKLCSKRWEGKFQENVSSTDNLKGRPKRLDRTGQEASVGRCAR